MKRSLISLILGCLVLGLVGIPASRVSAITLTLYDDFEGGVIDPNKWSGDEGSGGGAPNAEAARLTYPSGTSRELALVLFSYGSTANNTGSSADNRLKLSVANPAPILLMQAQVTVQFALTQPCAANTTTGTVAYAGLQGWFFNDGSSTGPSDFTGEVAAQITMRQNSLTGLNTITASIFRCNDSNCIDSTTLGSVTFGTSWLPGQPRVLVLWWDPANSRFIFMVDPGTPTVEPHTLTYSVTATNPALTASRQLRIKNIPANCMAGRTLAVMFASFDNVVLGQ